MMRDARHKFFNMEYKRGRNDVRISLTVYRHRRRHRRRVDDVSVDGSECDADEEIEGERERDKLLVRVVVR